MNDKNVRVNNTDLMETYEVEELDFSDNDPHSFQDLVPPEVEEEDDTLLNRDITPSIPKEVPSDDDLSPETLIKEDGSGSPYERQSAANAADESLTVVNENAIGAGQGLDEAELAQQDSPEKAPDTFQTTKSQTTKSQPTKSSR